MTARPTMDRVRLGMTDLQVSPICFGTWQLGGDWGGVRRARGHRRDPPRARARRELLRHRAGLRLRRLGAAARPRAGVRAALPPRRGRDRHQGRAAARRQRRGRARRVAGLAAHDGVEQSLRALDVDHIDLYQLHWPDPAVPVAETAGALQELVDEGKIRHVGVSNFDAAQMAAFARDAAGRDAAAAVPPVPPRHRGGRCCPYCERARHRRARLRPARARPADRRDRRAHHVRGERLALERARCSRARRCAATSGRCGGSSGSPASSARP